MENWLQFVPKWALRHFHRQLQTLTDVPWKQGAAAHTVATRPWQTATSPHLCLLLLHVVNLAPMHVLQPPQKDPVVLYCKQIFKMNLQHSSLMCMWGNLSTTANWQAPSSAENRWTSSSAVRHLTSSFSFRNPTPRPALPCYEDCITPYFSNKFYSSKNFHDAKHVFFF